jgi:hypothetical protein
LSILADLDEVACSNATPGRDCLAAWSLSLQHDSLSMISSATNHQAKNHVNQSMTMEQLLEAETRSRRVGQKDEKIQPSSIEIPPNASTA